MYLRYLRNASQTSETSARPFLEANGFVHRDWANATQLLQEAAQSVFSLTTRGAPEENIARCKRGARHHYSATRTAIATAFEHACTRVKATVG